MRGVWLSNTSVLYISREPKRMDDIRDRRNELAANISSNKRSTYRQMNELAGQDLLADRANNKYHPIKVRAITMSDKVAASLDYDSKLSRDPSQIRLLREHGKDRARNFLTDMENQTPMTVPRSCPGISGAA